MTAPAEPELPVTLQLQVRWDQVVMPPTTPVNQLLIHASPGPTGQPDAILFTVGYAPPPLLAGTAEQQRELFESLSNVLPEVHGRFLVGIDRARQFYVNLGTTLAAIEQATTLAVQSDDEVE